MARALTEVEAGRRRWPSPTCAAPSWRRRRTHPRSPSLAAAASRASSSVLRSLLSSSMRLLISLRSFCFSAITAACFAWSIAFMSGGQVALHVVQLDRAARDRLDQVALAADRLAVPGHEARARRLDRDRRRRRLARLRRHRRRRRAVADRRVAPACRAAAPAPRRSACAPPACRRPGGSPCTGRRPATRSAATPLSAAWSVPHWIVCSWIPLLAAARAARA